MTISFPESSLPLSVPLDKGNEGSSNEAVQMIDQFLFSVLSRHYGRCISDNWILTHLGARQNTAAPRYNEPRYNEDPVITNNIWKPGRITVKYGETNPAITKSPL